MIHLPSLAIGMAVAYAIPGSLLATILLQDWIRERRVQRTDGTDIIDLDERRRGTIQTPRSGRGA